MSAASVARKNRRMKIRQNLPALISESNLSILSSPELNSVNKIKNSNGLGEECNKINIESIHPNSAHIGEHESYESLSDANNSNFVNSTMCSQPIEKIFIEEDGK